jgi:malate permease and related proteins
MTADLGFILCSIMLPMAAIIGLGYGLQKAFSLDLRTLARFSMYALIPCLVFVRVYEASFEWAELGRVLLYALSVMAALYALGLGASALLRLPRSRRLAFGNSLMFFNSGNYGLPLIDLAFKGDPVAVTGQLMIVIIQNVMGNSFGVFQAGRGGAGARRALARTLSQPSIWAMALVFAVKAAGVAVPAPVLTPMRYLSDGFIGFALFTLGASLAGIKAKLGLRDALVSSALKLAAAPAIGFLLVRLFGFQGALARSLILGVATPAAVNTAIIAREMGNEPDYAAHLVLVSTALSPLTLSALILLLDG